MPKIIHFLIPLIIIPIKSLAADDLNKLFSFARANVDKFENEIKSTEGIHLNSTVTIRIKEQGFGVLSKYDPKKSQFISENGESLYTINPQPKCKSSGSYIGTSIFGRKYTIQKLTCSAIILEPTNNRFELGDKSCRSWAAGAEYVPISNDEECKGITKTEIVINMSASEYRTLKNKGVLYEIEFNVGEGADQEIVKKSTHYSKPTIDHTQSKTTSEYTVHGKIQKVKVYSSDGKILFTQYPKLKDNALISPTNAAPIGAENEKPHSD